jgi:hypothetical protein
MGDVRVKLNLSGVKEVLNSDGAVNAAMKSARKICSAANESAPEHGYYKYKPFAVEESKTSKGNRCAVVYTRTTLGKRMQAKNSTLTKSIGAGRG